MTGKHKYLYFFVPHEVVFLVDFKPKFIGTDVVIALIKAIKYKLTENIWLFLSHINQHQSDNYKNSEYLILNRTLLKKI
ncbi:LOW QUALITY PROTEIN: hypothetical protein HZS_3337 [Henneguya salminicola]|nr:LOW QUALITY PROTEIN: hypothetical protein HZS_3337 [Henneguya salminicola]